MYQSLKLNSKGKTNNRSQCLKNYNNTIQTPTHCSKAQTYKGETREQYSRVRT